MRYLFNQIINLIEYGSIINQKAEGLLKVDGKDYELKVRDFMEFIFNLSINL